MKTKSVEVLLLGSGWSSAFLLPLLRSQSISYAYTSRSVPSEDEKRDGKIQFQLTEPVDSDSVAALPKAKIVVIIFPIMNASTINQLVDAYESVHGSGITRWIQLGSSGIWPTGRNTSSSPVNSTNQRAIAEQSLLDLDHPAKRRTCVLNLAGLYGGARIVKRFASRVGSTKQNLSLKGSVHFIHGKDLARAIVLMHQSDDRAWGRRWITSDTNVYDWWLLVKLLHPQIPDQEKDVGPIWVDELVKENGVRSLPRLITQTPDQKFPQYLDRALDGQEFWDLVNSKPQIRSVLEAPETIESMDQPFQPQPFDPTIPQDKVESLIDTLQHDIKREMPLETSFEMDKDRFGITSARFESLRDEWIPFLQSDSTSEKRPGPDHNTWAAHQAYISSFSHYKVEIEDVHLHFIHEKASVSDLHDDKVRTIPLLLLHGWPGSFHDFLSVIKPLAHPGQSSKVHFDIVVPSQPGYVFSSKPHYFHRNSKTGNLLGIHSGPEGDFTIQDVARVMDKLMTGLGYQQYAVQAGDWGSGVLRSMANQFPNRVVATHLNFCPALAPAVTFPLVPVHWTPSWIRRLPQWIPKSLYARRFPMVGAFVDLLWSLASFLSLGALPTPPTQWEREKMKRGLEFTATGQAYALFHNTRPSTLGICLSQSPLSTLGWVAEKWIAWSDETCITDYDILASVTLWQLTATLPRSLYPYRNRSDGGIQATASNPNVYIRQPTGFSDFPKEIIPVPKSFVQSSVHLEWYRSHGSGSHFAALERPEAFVKDIQDCFQQIWPLKTGS